MCIKYYDVKNIVPQMVEINKHKRKGANFQHWAIWNRVGRRWHFKKHAPQKVANISKTNFAANFFFLNITHF